MPHTDTARRLQPPPMSDHVRSGEIDASIRADLRAEAERMNRAFEAGVRYSENLRPRWLYLIAWVSGAVVGALITSAMEMLR